MPECLENQEFIPKIVGFLCQWCAYAGADAAGRQQRDCPYDLRVVRLMCSGRIDPQFILQAFKEGADGVMVLGCHPGDCHYKEGNISALKRILLLKRVLKQRGIEEERLCLDWVSANEAEKFVKVVAKMAGKLQKIGPFSGNKYA